MSVSYADALSRIEAAAATLRTLLFSRGPDSLPLDGSLGATSYADVRGDRTLPPLDNSAMDGYAVSSSETALASPDDPVRLRIVGSIAAGDHPPAYIDDGDDDRHHPLTPPLNTCYIINTGAPFPLPSSSSISTTERFDACLRKEDAQLSTDGLYCEGIIKPVKARQHRRRAGEDFLPGIKLLYKGDTITPERIAALSCHGIANLPCVKQPKIAVLSTGKELEQVEETHAAAPECSRKTPPSHIYDSNSHYIVASLRSWGYHNISRLESLGDDPEDFRRTVLTCAEEAYDLLITTGGVSKGQHDYIEATLEKVGAKIRYHGTRMRPGHPALLATMQTSPSGPAPQRQLAVFGLPGNPCAAAATLRFMVRPFLRLSMGRSVELASSKARLAVSSAPPATSHVSAKMPSGRPGIANGSNGQTSSDVTSACGEGVKSAKHRSYFLATYEGYSQEGVRMVKTLNKGSGMVRPLSQADCWVLLREDQSEEDGVLVDCYHIAAGLR